jgi:hypothetical protein
MDYVLKLQGHTSMSNLIGVPLLYFWFWHDGLMFLVLVAGSGAQQLQHFSTTKMLQNCVTCG